MLVAITLGNLEEVKKLLETSEEDWDTKKALEVLQSKNFGLSQQDVIRFFLDRDTSRDTMYIHKAKCNIPFVMESQLIDLIRLYVEFGASYSTGFKTKYHPIYTAVNHEHFKLFEYFLDLGLSPNAPAKSGSLLSYVTIQANTTDFMKILLARGADPNMRFRDGSTVLHYFCNQSTHVHNSEDKLRFLLENGADPNIENRVGQGPLNLIKYKLGYSPRRLSKTVSLLIEYGANYEHKDNKGNSYRMTFEARSPDLDFDELVSEVMGGKTIKSAK